MAGLAKEQYWDFTMPHDSLREPEGLATVTVPRCELQTNQALVRLLDRTTAILMRQGQRRELDCTDLDAAYRLAVAAIRRELRVALARRQTSATSKARRPARGRSSGSEIVGVAP